MRSERQHPTAGLPPSPLTPVVEAIPLARVALPWHVLAFVFPAVIAVTQVVCLPLARLHPRALAVWIELALVLVPRLWLAGFCAVLVDRAAPSWPRTVRWAVAMGLIGLVPGVYYFLERQAPIPQWLWGWKWWIIAAALRDACFGAGLAWAAQCRRGAEWKAAGVGGLIWAAYLLVDFSFGGILLGWPQPRLHWTSAQVALSALSAAACVGVVLVCGVLSEWRRLTQGE